MKSPAGSVEQACPYIRVQNVRTGSSSSLSRRCRPGHPRRSSHVLISQRSAHRSEVVLFNCVSSSLRGWRLFRILLIVGVPTLKLCSEIRNPVQDTRLAVPSLEESVDRLVFTPIRQIQAEASSRPRVCPSSAPGLGPNAKRMVSQALGGRFSPGRKTKRKSQTVNGGSR